MAAVVAVAAESPVVDVAPEVDQSAERLAPSVPRLRLTRTESEQSRLGARGSVELVVADEDTSVTQATEEAELDSDSNNDNDSADSLEEGSSSEDDRVIEQLVRNRRSAMESVEEEPEEVAEEAEAIALSLPTQLQQRPQVSPQQPVLARFVEAKRNPAKRSSSSSSLESAASGDSGRAQVSSARSSRERTMSAPDARPTSPVESRVSSRSDRSSPSSGPDRPSAPLRTVQQLRSQEGGTSKSRPNMGRPRSTRSLRAGGSRLEVMPEDVEAEAEATSSGGEMQPSWARLAKLRTDAPVSTSSSERSISPPSRLASPRWTHSQSSSSGTSLQSLQEHERHSRSLDLDRDYLKPSPLTRSMSTTSDRPSSVRSETSATSKKAGKQWDFEAIAASGRQPRGLGKFFQPPLASSMATKAAPVVAVANPRRNVSPERAASLRHVSLSPHRFEDEDDDAQSISGISIMSAPQLSPVRPPRNPARLGAASVVKPIPAALLEPDLPSRDRYTVSAAPSPRPESPAPDQMETRAVERSVARERTPPPMPAPIPGIMAPGQDVAPVASAAMSRANSSATSRPLSSHLAPSSVDFGLTALALSPRVNVSKQKSSRRFGLFRRSEGTDASATKRKFEPSLDLVYDTIDASVFRKKLQSDEVLVETVAVGVDHFDRERLWQLAKVAGGTGWVPGRSIVGNVLAMGDSVSRLKKGDLVWGLAPLKKVTLPISILR